jgi:phosphate/sulfate permease
MGVGIAFGGPGSITWGTLSGPRGPTGVKKIILSWFISPVIAGAVAMALFAATKLAVLTRTDSHARMLALYPGFVAVTFMVVIFFISLQTIEHVDSRPAAEKAAHPWVTKTASGGKMLTGTAQGVVVGVTVGLTAVVAVAAFFAKRTAAFARYVDSIPMEAHGHGGPPAEQTGLLAKGHTGRSRQLLQHHEADVMAGVGVAITGIAKSNQQLQIHREASVRPSADGFSGLLDGLHRDGRKS